MWRNCKRPETKTWTGGEVTYSESALPLLKYIKTWYFLHSLRSCVDTLGIGPRPRASRLYYICIVYKCTYIRIVCFVLPLGLPKECEAKGSQFFIEQTKMKHWWKTRRTVPKYPAKHFWIECQASVHRLLKPTHGIPFKGSPEGIPRPQNNQPFGCHFSCWFKDLRHLFHGDNNKNIGIKQWFWFSLMGWIARMSYLFSPVGIIRCPATVFKRAGLLLYSTRMYAEEIKHKQEETLTKLWTWVTILCISVGNCLC